VSRTEIGSAIDAFKEMGVVRVAPSHRSGDGTRKQTNETFGDGYLPARADSRIRFEAEPES
jgi:hypothetical protein